MNLASAVQKRLVAQVGDCELWSSGGRTEGEPFGVGVIPRRCCAKLRPKLREAETNYEYNL